MPAVITACFRDRPAVEAVLPEHGQYRIGRDDECDVILHHPTVSKIHALLSKDEKPWRLIDSSSSNGIQINGDFVSDFELYGNELITLGAVECLFEVQSEIQRQAVANHNQWRRSQAQQTQLSNSQSLNLADMLEERLFSMLSLTGLQRGMILIGQSLDELMVCSAKAMRHQDFSIAEFEGSIGAIKSCLETQQNIIAMDVSKNAMLCKRNSIQQKHIAALSCLPIIEQSSQQLLGLIYLDSKLSSKVLTELDLEILNTLNQQVGLNLQAMSVTNQLDALMHEIAKKHRESKVVNQPILSLVS